MESGIKWLCVCSAGSSDPLHEKQCVCVCVLQAAATPARVCMRYEVDGGSVYVVVFVVVCGCV
jgi:hypothetical protein